MTFELKQPTTVKLKNAQSRPEHHGDVLVLAMDLRIVWTTNNRALDMLSPTLRESLFSVLPVGVKSDGDQEELDLPVSERPFVSMLKLKYPVKWEEEMSGYTLRLDFGLGGASDSVVNVCVLKNFAISPIEGGSVEIEFTVSSSADINGSIVGRFSEKQQQDIVITLLAPAVVEGDVIDTSAGSGAPGTGPALEAPKPPKAKSKAHQTATDAFIDQHAPADGAPVAH